MQTLTLLENGFAVGFLRLSCARHDHLFMSYGDGFETLYFMRVSY